MPPSTHTRQEQEKQIPQHPLLQGRAVCIETLLYGIAGGRSRIWPLSEYLGLAVTLDAPCLFLPSL